MRRTFSIPEALKLGFLHALIIVPSQDGGWVVCKAALPDGGDPDVVAVADTNARLVQWLADSMGEPAPEIETRRAAWSADFDTAQKLWAMLDAADKQLATMMEKAPDLMPAESLALLNSLRNARDEANQLGIPF